MPVQRISHPNNRARTQSTSALSRIVRYIAVIAFCALAALYINVRGPAEVLNDATTVKAIDSSPEAGSGSAATLTNVKAAPLIRGGNVNANVGNNNGAAGDSSSSLPDTVTLMTSQGDIVIQLRPDQALDSVKYIKALLDSATPCKDCRFYRAEQHGILQGILKKEGVPRNKVLGTCPEEFKDVPKCHGPMMTRGMVGWAAGEAGPDFFIDNYHKPAEWWSHDHTVWGEIVDEASLEVVKSFFDLPATKKVLTYLDKAVHITIK